MRKFFKYTLITAFVMSFIGTLSASEAPRDATKTNFIDSRAMVQEDFSGLETAPIVRAFITWMNETNGDIAIMPPTEGDGLFYDVAISGKGNDLNVFNMDLAADGSNPDPWQKGCRPTFYVIRVTSSHPTVKMIDGENRQVLAFTFTGCTFKFIAVVADRMRDEQMLYTTMLHELGHMWGLPDNKGGEDSIMNGSWPGSTCITKRDLRDVYEKNGKRGLQPKDRGC
jgi:hypothetical protein